MEQFLLRAQIFEQLWTPLPQFCKSGILDLAHALSGEIAHVLPDIQ
jgi:hypothetical protein